MSHPSLSEQEIIRREKLKSLGELGIDAYPAAAYPVNTHAAEIKSNYTEENKANLNPFAWQGVL